MATDTELIDGGVYLVKHRRQGNFTVKIISADDEWVKAEIIAGEAKYITAESAIEGDVITIRKSLCVFTIDKRD